MDNKTDEAIERRWGMNKRVCEGCRFYVADAAAHGRCTRHAPIGDCGFAIVYEGSTCGEWRDKGVTTEQEERREMGEQMCGLFPVTKQPIAENLLDSVRRLLCAIDGVQDWKGTEVGDAIEEVEAVLFCNL